MAPNIKSNVKKKRVRQLICNQSLSQLLFEIQIVSAQIRKIAMIFSPHMILALMNLYDII